MARAGCWSLGLLCRPRSHQGRQDVIRRSSVPSVTKSNRRHRRRRSAILARNPATTRGSRTDRPALSGEIYFVRGHRARSGTEIRTGTSRTKKLISLGPYRKPTPRVPGESQGGWRFLMGEVPLKTALRDKLLGCAT